MTRAYVYNRVSTDQQESSGTSLGTQRDNCLQYCQDRGYTVSQAYQEAYSGLKLDRPMLNELREAVRAGLVDVVVVYSLDRLTRDPGHGVIITQELEKHEVRLEAVTEDVDNSELGKLISYIRGFASKLEAEKIKERTIRGRRARSKEGKLAAGGNIIFGYDFIKGEGRRLINETEADWVRQMFHWAASEGASISAITNRLRANNVLTKQGKYWYRSGVAFILHNQAYTGRTVAFTNSAEPIVVEGATPAIISKELFDAAQKQLNTNHTKTQPQTVHKYLLRGHIKCKCCGYAYSGSTTRDKSYYRCTTSRPINSPNGVACNNKSWSAAKLEKMVWQELEAYLSDRDTMKAGLEMQRDSANQLGAFETELKQIESSLKAVTREQHQLLQWALKDFPADQVEVENKRLNASKKTLETRHAEVMAQLKASQNAVINVPKLEAFLDRMQASIKNLDFEGKRLALEMLNITIWVDGDNIEVTGIINPALESCLSDYERLDNTPTYPFSLKVKSGVVK